MLLHRLAGVALIVLASVEPAAAQRPRAATPARPAPAPMRSAPIGNVRYEVTLDSAGAQSRTIRVAMSFDVGAGTEPVLLSLPAWTPGAYEIDNFARWVADFSAAAGDRALRWDKVDPDTWRVRPQGAGRVTVRFEYLADTLDNAIAWARPDFGFFNGTNVFFYPEGRGFEFPAVVTIRTEPDWKVATGMKPAGEPRSYTEANYHDLVDMPFFVGRFDLDSTVVAGRTTRLATYPAGALSGAARGAFWDQIAKAVPVMGSVFAEIPWESYTVLAVFDSGYGGGSALEHQNSHLGIYNPQFIGTPMLASVTAHEIFHAWNVKRLRPADMVPYAYDRAQPTPWLWVSEGITDYYSDLALVRGAIADSSIFFMLTAEKIQAVSDLPPTSLHDASLSTWIDPVDGTHYLYYQKGSLAGLLLDILVRDASDNRRSLDDVMRELYRTTYKRGRGFTATDWWSTLSRAAGGRSFAEFAEKYVDGRDPYPYASVLALAGLRLAADTTREPRLGIAAAPDSAGVRVAALLPGGVAEQAGVKVGDILVALGDVPINDPNFGAAFRSRFAGAEGQSLPIKVRRGTDTLTVVGQVRLMEHTEARVEPDPAAPPKAAGIRHSLLRGRTE
jgi:predicted metalloprotease with PDZ domain